LNAFGWSATREDFVNQGLGDLITVTHRDVCANGFKTDTLGESRTLPFPFLSFPFSFLLLRNKTCLSFV
jgi:hypothetical protein